MGIIIAIALFASIILIIALYTTGDDLYHRYPEQGMGRFASRAIHLALGIILSPLLVIVIVAVVAEFIGPIGMTGLLLPLLPLLAIVALGIRYRGQSHGRSRVELLGLCFGIALVVWVVMPGLGAGYAFESLNEYADNYGIHDLPATVTMPYMLGLLIAGVTFIALGILLIWRAGRLARMYDTPAVQPDSDHPAGSLETKIS